jgi:hypothetical protein
VKKNKFVLINWKQIAKKTTKNKNKSVSKKMLLKKKLIVLISKKVKIVQQANLSSQASTKKNSLVQIVEQKEPCKRVAR